MLASKAHFPLIDIPKPKLFLQLAHGLETAGECAAFLVVFSTFPSRPTLFRADSPLPLGPAFPNRALCTPPLLSYSPGCNDRPDAAIHFLGGFPLLCPLKARKSNLIPESLSYISPLDPPPPPRMFRYICLFACLSISPVPTSH